MANLTSLGGYPITVSGLTSGTVILFNGREWIGSPETVQNPTLYPLDPPSIAYQANVSFDGLPVIIYNLQPGDVLSVVGYSGFAPIDQIASAPNYQPIITNVPWSKLYTSISGTMKPETALDTDTSATDRVAPQPTVSLTYTLS